MKEYTMETDRGMEERLGKERLEKKEAIVAVTPRPVGKSIN
jgi:hypothetical protein